MRHKCFLKYTAFFIVVSCVWVKAGAKPKGRAWPLTPFDVERPELPNDWATENVQASEAKCGSSYMIADLGHKKFVLDSEGEECSVGFLGSVFHSCTVGLLCDGTVELSSSGDNDCTDGHLTISDGTDGREKMCGPSSFARRPRTAGNGGTDVYITFKGTSLGSPCAVFCIEDLNNSYYTINTDVKYLDANLGFKGLKTTDSCTCGIPNNGITGRIIGGVRAAKFEFPWLGGLTGKIQDFMRFPLCGLQLINDRFALTAAHCFKQFEKKPWRYQVILHIHIVDKSPIPDGMSDEDFGGIPGWNLPVETDESENTVRRDVEEIIYHPMYGVHSEFAYDIAILKLKTPVQMETLNVAPICLPSLSHPYLYNNGDPMEVAGWGKIRSNLPVNSRELWKVTVPFIDFDTCYTLLERHYSLFCAGYLEGRKDSCTGDSGGPLIYKIDDEKDQYILTGIVSNGDGCARRDKPGLYTDVAEVVNWIYHITTKDEDALWCAQ